MKTISKIMMLITLLVVVACNSNDASDLPAPQEEYGTVEFSFDVKESETNDGGRKESAGRAENTVPARVVISIENAAGELLYNAHEMPLQVSTDGNFTTGELTLLVGDYTITEYFVEDEAGTTIYVTPQEGSTLAYLVNDPLPILFTVAKDANTQESPEVIDPTGYTPEDFGYPSFRLNIVNTIDFLVAVSIRDVQTGTYDLTDAAILVTENGNTVYSGTLAGVTNQVRVRDGFDNYAIRISKVGYIDYNNSFDRAALESYENSPIYVLLDPDATVHTVDANANSISGGTGVDGGSYLEGEVIRLWADPNDTWELFPNDLIVNAEGVPVADHPWTFGGITTGVGTLVGSWDNGANLFVIGLYEEISAPAGGGSLTLWCFDSDKDNNTGTIDVSIQKF